MERSIRTHPIQTSLSSLFSYTQNAERLCMGHNKIAGSELGLGFLRLQFFFCFVTKQIPFPKFSLLSQGLERCSSLQNFSPRAINKNQYNCPNASTFPQNSIFAFQNHRGPCLPDICARGKDNLFFNWLCYPQQFGCVCGTGKKDNHHLTLSRKLIETISMNNLEKQKSDCNKLTFD